MSEHNSKIKSPLLLSSWTGGKTRFLRCLLTPSPFEYDLILLPAIQPGLRARATHFVGVILDLSTCSLGVYLIQPTVIYRAPVAARCLCCGNTLGSSGTRFSLEHFTVLTHLPCPMFNGFLSPLSTCSQPSEAWMNMDPSITWHTVVLMPLHLGHRGLN